MKEQCVLQGSLCGVLLGRGTGSGERGAAERQGCAMMGLGRVKWSLCAGGTGASFTECSEKAVFPSPPVSAVGIMTNFLC